MCEMTQYSGHPLLQPLVECHAPNGEFIEGVVVKAVWLDGAEFDMDGQFVVRTDDLELIKVSGWNVDTEIVGVYEH